MFIIKFMWILLLVYLTNYISIRASVSEPGDHGSPPLSNNSGPEDTLAINCNQDQINTFEQFKIKYTYNQALSDVCDVDKYFKDLNTNFNARNNVGLYRNEIMEIIEACKFLANTNYISNNFLNLKTTLNKHLSKIQNFINNETKLLNEIKSLNDRKNNFLAQWNELNNQYTKVNECKSEIKQIFHLVDTSIIICNENVEIFTHDNRYITSEQIRDMLDVQWKDINEKKQHLMNACENKQIIPAIDESVTDTIVDFNKILNEIKEQLSEIDEKYDELIKEKSHYQSLLSNVESNKRQLLADNFEQLKKNYKGTMKIIENNKNKRNYWDSYIKTITSNLENLPSNEKESFVNMITNLKKIMSENIDEDNFMSMMEQLTQQVPLKIEQWENDCSVMVSKIQTDYRNIQTTVDWIEAFKKIIESNFYRYKIEYINFYERNIKLKESYTIDRDISSVTKYIDDINTLTEIVKSGFKQDVKLTNSASVNLSKMERQGEKLNRFLESFKKSVDTKLTNDTEGSNHGISDPIIDSTKLPNKKNDFTIEKDQQNNTTPNTTENSSKMENKSKKLTIVGVVLGIVAIIFVVIGVVIYRKKISTNYNAVDFCYKKQ